MSLQTDVCKLIEFQEPWFLVQLKPNSFRMAERNLVRQGFTVFHPTHEQIRKRGSKCVTEITPLFPGYMFVSFDVLSAPWRVINNTYGVSRLVTLGRTAPRQVPDGLIIALMTRCNGGEFLCTQEVLSSGDRVRVVEGPFTDFITEIESISPDRRVWILLDVLGGATKVAISAESLQKVQSN